MTANIFTPEQEEILGDNLDPKNVKTLREGSKAQYIEGWHAINEANRIFGFGAWDQIVMKMVETNRELVEVTRQVQNRPTKENQWRVGYLYVVRITVYGPTGETRSRDGTGFGSGYAKENALGEAIESAAKEAETDAMKRALKSFGNQFGLALYDKSKANVGASLLGESEEQVAQRDPPPAQLKIAEGLIADFEATDDPDGLWKHPNTKKYVKAWYEDKTHDLYNRMVAAASAAKKRVLEESKNAPSNDIPFPD